jgi:hypothetical protein
VTRHDDLAQRFASRLKQAPARGRDASQRASTSAAESGAPRAAGTTTKTIKNTGARAARTTARTTARKAAARQTAKTAPAEAREATKSTKPTTATVAGAASARSARRRGHLVPDVVHARALRRKIEIGARDSRTVSWGEVIGAGLEVLLRSDRSIAAGIAAAGAAAPGPGHRRLVQTALAPELEQRLALARLDSIEAGRPLSFEQLWTAAIVAWLDANRA